MTGIIVKALSGFYYVSCDSKTYECKARGSFRKSGVSPLVGDKVEFLKTDNEHGIIDSILPRRNCITRPPVANIDKLFIVSSFTKPAPNTSIIDRMTAIANYNNIEPIIVFNKCDMGDFTPWQKIYNNAGFKVITVSAVSGDGAEKLRQELKDSISAFTGNSGVGKSSLLNLLFEKEIIKTGEISEKLGRGRHTTRHTELYELPFGGFVADTPGFSTFDLGSDDFDFKESLPYLFKDFEEYIPLCRFSSCTHTSENGCAVIAAVNSGKIEPTRHSSYIEIFEETKNLKPWQGKKRK